MREMFEKARKLRVELDIDTSNAVYCSVYSSKQKYSVSMSKQTHKVWCDCEWFSTRQGICSHILAMLAWLSSNYEENPGRKKAWQKTATAGNQK